MSSEAPPDIPLAEVGRYRKFSEAQERGLVPAAMELPYWVIREGPDFVLFVEAAAQTAVAEELAKFEAEAAEHRDHVSRPPVNLPKLNTLSLFVAGWVMSMAWLGQNLVSENWTSRGSSLNSAIFQGEWWRLITSLTLHGDLAHFVANLSFGLLFAGFLLPRFGTGVTWLGFVVSGALGNLLNAWFYHTERHSTIGASTAVFGALGMLVAWELVDRWRTPRSRGWWQLVVPLGGGLALLAYLGAGDERGGRVDYMAHLWGFTAGLAMGGLLAWARTYERFPRAAQWLLSTLAVLMPIVAWTCALRFR
jgi:membrane associated rhomboid family serine protease